MKLNNKGFMIVEVIVASTILVVMLYFLLEITFKLVNKNNDYYLESILITDKSLITKEIMDDINSMELTNVSCIDDSNSCDLVFNNDNSTKKKLTVNDRMVKYGDYSKTFNSDLNLSDIQIESDVDSEILILKISAYTNYSKEDYGIKIIVPYDPNIVKVVLPIDDNEKEEVNNEL